MLNDLYFNKRERNGIVVLLLILFSLVSFYYLMPYFYAKPQTDYSEFQNEVLAVVAKFDSIKQSKRSNLPQNERFVTKDQKNLKESHSILKQEDFNPNNASETLLVQNGIPSFIAKRIIKYRSSGGVFKKKEDLQKIYGFSDSLYDQIEAFIVLPKKHETSKLPFKSSTRTEERQNQPILDLNESTAEEFTQLRGIGKVYGKRIVEYRNRLGGYVRKEQLKEVYGISDSLYYELELKITVSNEVAMQLLNINTASIGELSRHPYFTYTMAKNITEYRDKKGKINTIEELVEVDVINTYQLAKIKPYIRVKNKTE